MSAAKKAQMQASARVAFPTTVRHAIHDLSQPLQALRMMLGLPGVVVDDQRGLSGKVDTALAEIDLQLSQLHTLSRLIDTEKYGTVEVLPFAKTLDYAEQLSPELWQKLKSIRVYGRDCPMLLPSRNAAWTLNAVLDYALRTRPKTRIVVGARSYGKWVIVADDGDGMTQDNAEALEQTLNGGHEVSLGSGLLLARLMVAGWDGHWRVISKEGKGTVIAFSVPVS